MMKKVRGASLLGIAILMGMTYVAAQETKPAKPAPAAKAETTKKAARGRLPPYFAKAGISDVQREKVYSIQAKYKPEIDKLEEQLKALRAQEMTEVEGVLTAEQKTRVTELRAEAQKKRDEAKKKTAESDDDEQTEKPAATGK
ncbi:MAG TPA: hypothetical protein VHB77_10135 [Planctomycetaceae bacterium]|nr:hypothetical protein [Planctomycetaceae bacterium]